MVAKRCCSSNASKTSSKNLRECFWKFDLALPEILRGAQWSIVLFRCSASFVAPAFGAIRTSPLAALLVARSSAFAEPTHQARQHFFQFLFVDNAVAIGVHLVKSFLHALGQ